jgi:hypothetical protein
MEALPPAKPSLDLNAITQEFLDEDDMNMDEYDFDAPADIDALGKSQVSDVRDMVSQMLKGVHPTEKQTDSLVLFLSLT